jgi:hypothetical protein
MIGGKSNHIRIVHWRHFTAVKDYNAEAQGLCHVDKSLHIPRIFTPFRRAGLKELKQDGIY